jgi:hypothetical protein
MTSRPPLISDSVNRRWSRQRLSLGTMPTSVLSLLGVCGKKGVDLFFAPTRARSRNTSQSPFLSFLYPRRVSLGRQRKARGRVSLRPLLALFSRERASSFFRILCFPGGLVGGQLPGLVPWAARAIVGGKEKGRNFVLGPRLQYDSSCFFFSFFSA